MTVLTSSLVIKIRSAASSRSGKTGASKTSLRVSEKEYGVAAKDFDFNDSAAWVCKAVVASDFWVRL